MPTPSVYQMAYFPPDQYEQAWARGLLNPTNHRDHGDYRREVEQTMRGLADQGTGPIRVMRLDVADLLAYAQHAGKDPTFRQTRLDYTGWLHETGRPGEHWPPGRNDVCWCGSGGKYKKCCGNPAFLTAETPDPASLILRIDLDGVTPAVWRRVAVPSNTTLDVVHEMIQAAMGWHGDHMYVFDTDQGAIIDPRSTSGEPHADLERLVSIATEQGDTFTYTYDFGDEWTHTVTLEEIRPGGADNLFTLIDGDGACPPEDCGGVPGYLHLLDALADPTHPRHDEAVEWLGEDYDPARWHAIPASQEQS